MPKIFVFFYGTSSENLRYYFRPNIDPSVDGMGELGFLIKKFGNIIDKVYVLKIDLPIYLKSNKRLC